MCSPNPSRVCSSGAVDCYLRHSEASASLASVPRACAPHAPAAISCPAVSRLLAVSVRSIRGLCVCALSASRLIAHSAAFSVCAAYGHGSSSHTQPLSRDDLQLLPERLVVITMGQKSGAGIGEQACVAV